MRIPSHRMDPPDRVSDDAIQALAAAYIDAWNSRDREAWLALLHPKLKFTPTTLVDTRIYHGIEGAATYFDELVASNRLEQALIVALRRLGPNRFLIELELVINEAPVADACIIARLADGTFIETSGHFSDVKTLTSIRVIPEEAPLIGKTPGTIQPG